MQNKGPSTWICRRSGCPPRRGLHFVRVSGAAMFLALPLVIWLLQGTLSSAETFDCYKSAVGNPLVKVILLGLLWSFMHHASAGVRFLFLDMHKGTGIAGRSCHCQGSAGCESGSDCRSRSNRMVNRIVGRALRPA